eukprot:TRINITY_DN15942_c0_g1_i3.p1 TRINITY_DN15942_c0_g1~~TRINITY_DN15942_c0_g1_i3.p1  ORF type:complete len:705 (+),score=101.43 TRINITY_DN15942_c0_g1_i3:313-2427(+)
MVHYVGMSNGAKDRVGWWLLKGEAALVVARDNDGGVQLVNPRGAMSIWLKEWKFEVAPLSKSRLDEWLSHYRYLIDKASEAYAITEELALDSMESEAHLRPAEHKMMSPGLHDGNDVNLDVASLRGAVASGGPRPMDHASVAATASSGARSMKLHEPQQVPLRSDDVPEILSIEAAMITDDVLREKYLSILMFSWDVIRLAGGGMLLVVIPDALSNRLLFKTLDGGYMKRRIGGLTGVEARRGALLDFATHEQDDRWPADHPDEAARGRPKDGAIVFASSGALVACAVRLRHLPQRFAMLGGGTRHQGGLAVADWLAAEGEVGAVFIRSDSGRIKLLMARHLAEWKGAFLYTLANTEHAREFSSVPRTLGAAETDASSLAKSMVLKIPNIRFLAPSEILDVLKRAAGGNSQYAMILTMLWQILQEAAGGMLIVVVPSSLKRRLRFRTLDCGYMNGQLQGLSLQGETDAQKIRDVLLEFSKPENNDRWPRNHRHEAARDQPKDGAVVFSCCGRAVVGAAHLLHISNRFAMPDCGTRHQAGLGAADWLFDEGEEGAVFMRSDSGHVKILIPRHLVETCCLYEACSAHRDPGKDADAFAKIAIESMSDMSEVRILDDLDSLHAADVKLRTDHVNERIAQPDLAQQGEQGEKGVLRAEHALLRAEQRRRHRKDLVVKTTAKPGHLVSRSFPRRGAPRSDQRMRPDNKI